MTAVNSAHPLELEPTTTLPTYSADVQSSYTRTAIVLHWLIGVCILGQILFGWYLEEIPRGTPARALYVNLHKSVGLTLGLLILFRIFWRLRHTAPALPRSMPDWQRIAARISHFTLYACMLIMPTSGYIASNFSKWGVKYFNVLMLPPWGVNDKNIYAFFNTTHVLTSYVLVTLICVHVLSALSHAVSRDGVVRRMWFPRSE
ncbi:MAG: cytochrome b [Povalibacter sp.]